MSMLSPEFLRLKQMHEESFPLFSVVLFNGISNSQRVLISVDHPIRGGLSASKACRAGKMCDAVS